jgi:hypothetical protein
LGSPVIKCLRVDPRKASDELLRKVVKLHQKHFDLDAKSIIKYLMVRDYVDLYFASKGELVGTVGLQWYVQDKNVIMYVGNAVIDNKYQGAGLLSRSLLTGTFKTIFHYVSKRKYSIALATSPKAYSYFTKLKNYWPKPYEEIPPDIISLLGVFLKNNYQDHYHLNSFHVLVTPEENANIEAVQYTNTEKRFSSLWFSLENPAYEQGFQLPCIVKFDLANFYLLLKGQFRFRKLRRIFKKYNKTIYELTYKDLFYITLLSISLIFGFAYD